MTADYPRVRAAGYRGAMPRLRQAVVVARELEPTVRALRVELGLGEPYRDPAVAYFGLVNAVFAIGDTFLEVVSPVDLQAPGARTAARQLERSGADRCGYMAIVQVEDLAAARERARAAQVREVFEVELDDIAEVHLHPGDMRAMVALTEPRPATSWRWGGDDWRARSVRGAVAGVTVAVADPDATRSRWARVAGAPLAECAFVADARSAGIVRIDFDLGGVRRSLSLDHAKST
jgi:hypothetical protein